MTGSRSAPLRRPASGFVSIGLVIAATLAITLAWAVNYRPVVATGATPVSGPYRLPDGVAGLKLHVFNTGMNRMSAMLVGANPPWRPVPAFVLEDPQQGLVVFDCGLSAAVERDGALGYSLPTRWLVQSKGRVGRTLDAQMRETGLDPNKVRWVILSHLHEDHTGAAAAFPNATFIVGPGADADLIAPGFHPKWRAISFANSQRLPPFDAAIDLFGDGSVTLLPGGGHTREDLMAIVALPKGPVLLAGDAVVHRDWLASDDVQRIAGNPSRAADVRNQVRALLRERRDVYLFLGHDLDLPVMPRPDIVFHHANWFDLSAWM